MSSPWNSKRDDSHLKPNERDDFTEQMRSQRWFESLDGEMNTGETLDRDKLAEFGDPNGEYYRVTEERKETNENPRDTKQNNGDSTKGQLSKLNQSTSRVTARGGNNKKPNERNKQWD